MPLLTLALAAAAACGGGARENTASRQGWTARTWAGVARPVLGGQLGLRWGDGRWTVDPHWSGAGDAANSAYYAQPILDAALALAESRCDREWTSEIAGYFLAARERFQSFAELDESNGWTGRVGLRLHGETLAGTGATLTLPAHHARIGVIPEHQVECLLCVAQFLHPAAKLIRMVAALPDSQRTAPERAFVGAYLALIIQDQILRNAYEVQIDLGAPEGEVRGLVAAWRTSYSFERSRRDHFRLGIRDTHLWLLAAAAEILAANEDDPAFAPLSAEDRDRLRGFIAAGAARIRQSGSWRGTGEQETLDYFEGEFATHSDLAYAGDTLARFPTAKDSARVAFVGWDVSHATRLPLVLRSLRDGQPATGSDFPTERELRGITNQLLKHAFNGDWSRPLFRNFLDGTDGWYRVGYRGRGEWGYPPSRYCDGRRTDRPCLGANALPAWGALTGFNAGLAPVAERLIALAGSSDSAEVAFRERYYTQNGVFAFADPAGRLPSLVLFELVAHFPSQCTIPYRSRRANPCIVPLE